VPIHLAEVGIASCSGQVPQENEQKVFAIQQVLQTNGFSAGGEQFQVWHRLADLCYRHGSGALPNLFWGSPSGDAVDQG